MPQSHLVKPPLSDDDIEKFYAGDVLLISGFIYTARDSAHKRLIKMIEEGQELPVDLKGQIIYYVGPTPAPPGKPIGSAGPTTSSRMDPYTPKILELGVKALIGKGLRSSAVKDALVRNKAVYCSATGGAGAILGKKVIDAKVVAFEELGAEAIYKLEVKDFPCIVVNDIYGNDLYEKGVSAYKRI